MNGPRTVCITGMHRSGTSLAARVLQLLGVALGRPGSLMGPGPDNPVGYFEIRSMKELDDELLAHLGGAWDRPPILEDGWELDPGLDHFRTRAGNVLEDAFGAEPGRPPLMGWKDPRLSLLLPFWRTVTGIDTSVVVVRDPTEVASSLLARNGIGGTQAALLWLRYLLAAIANDPGHLLVRQRAFFDDLEPTLGSITAHLGLPTPTAAVIDEVRSHLDPGLQHHRAGAPEPSPDPVLALAQAVWNDGRVDRTRLDARVADAVRRGLLRPPADDAALTAARAQVVELQETVRRRKRTILALEDDLARARATSTVETAPPDPGARR
jgi:hypothetical protein